MDSHKKREAIIRSAREVIGHKGLMDSTVSEIAKKAGVADSIIYHYFKNKEDLLFSVVGRELKAMNKNLQYHFEGIIGPISKLGKMIWVHLSRNDTHTKEVGIVKNLLLESRGYSNFYKHEGYNSLKEYTKILKKILQQGVEEHFFHQDLNVNIVRDMIFGLLDETSIGCLNPKSSRKTMADFDDIMTLILNMITTTSNHSENQKNKGERILLAAKTIFAKKGFHKATMTEIAKRADVSDGTIYEYYKNKNDLLFSIPREHIKTHDPLFKHVIDNKDPLIKLKSFISFYFQFFLTDRAFIVVYLRDIKLNRKFLNSGLYDEYLHNISYLNEILDEGKEKGCFHENVNNRIFINLFIGTFSHLATRWLNIKDVTALDMMEELGQVISLLSSAVNKNLEFSMQHIVDRNRLKQPAAHRTEQQEYRKEKKLQTVDSKTGHEVAATD